MKPNYFLIIIEIILIGLMIEIAGCSQGQVDPNSGNGVAGETIKEIYGVCTFTYKNGKVATFQKRALSYLNDTCFVYYDNLGRIKRVVRQYNHTPDFHYTLAFYYYENSRVARITSITSYYLNDKINPDTLTVKAIGFDTITASTNRYFFDYDQQGRLWHKKVARSVNSYDDTIKYSDNTTRNISKVVRKSIIGNVDSVVFSQYETNANPVNKYIPEYFYAKIVSDDIGGYRSGSAPIGSGDGMSDYLILSPNYLKKVWFKYTGVYSSSFTEFTLNNIFDSRGNAKSSNVWVGVTSSTIGYLYSYD